MEKHKIINRKDIIENIMAHDYARTKHFIRNEYDIKITRKIISIYLHLMIEALFRGKDWALPSKFGRIRIKKGTYDVAEQVPFFKGHLKKTDASNKRVANPKTPGLVFSIEIKSKYMDRHKCRFRAGKTIRRRMFNEFYHGELAKTIR